MELLADHVAVSNTSFHCLRPLLFRIYSSSSTEVPLQCSLNKSSPCAWQRRGTLPRPDHARLCTVLERAPLPSRRHLQNRSLCRGSHEQTNSDALQLQADKVTCPPFMRKRITSGRVLDCVLIKFPHCQYAYPSPRSKLAVLPDSESFRQLTVHMSVFRLHPEDAEAWKLLAPAQIYSKQCPRRLQSSPWGVDLSSVRNTNLSHAQTRARELYFIVKFAQAQSRSRESGL